MAIKERLQEFKRVLAEQKELRRVKGKERARKKTSEAKQRLERSKEKETLARQHAEAQAKLAEQKRLEAEAVRQKRVASQQAAQAAFELRKEKYETVKAAIKPYFKPVQLGGLALRQVARGGIQKYYTLGTRPQQHSPSYEALTNTFGGEPFTSQQAVEVVSNALQTSYDDAWNRLHVMKNYGFIKESL